MERKIQCALERPLQENAIKPHPTKKFSDGTPFSTINPIFVAERLNDVFGIGEWSLTSELVSKGAPHTQITKSGKEWVTFKGGIVKVTLTLPNGSTYQQFGASDNEDEGDGLKGGVTDALTKLASYLGIASYVWKNLNYDQAMFAWFVKFGGLALTQCHLADCQAYRKNGQIYRDICYTFGEKFVMPNSEEEALAKAIELHAKYYGK